MTIVQLIAQAVNMQGQGDGLPGCNDPASRFLG